MSWAKGSDPGDVGEKHQLVHWFTSGYWPFGEFFPKCPRFRIFQEVPASAAAVPGVWGGWVFNGKWDGTCCGSLCRAYGRVPKCLVQICGL